MDESQSLGKWALRKEARRNMYAKSTEQARVHRRGLKASMNAAAMCQKCLRPGHWTYECKNEAIYVQRPSRSQQLRNPKLRQPFNKDKPPEMQVEELKTGTSNKRKLNNKSKTTAEKSSGRSRSKQRRTYNSSSSSDSSSSSSSSSDCLSSGSDSNSSDVSCVSSSSSQASNSSDSSSSSTSRNRSSTRYHKK